VADAVAEYDRIASAGAGESVSARFEAARALERAGDAAAARTRYVAIVEGDGAEAPANVSTRAAAALHLGNLELESGDLASAERRYRTAIELEPALVEAHFNLATLLGRAGRYAESAAAQARVLELQPGRHEARFGEAMALVLAGEHAAAVRKLERALELFPQVAALAHLLARVLVASPDDEVRDGARGLELARRLFDAQRVPDHAETLAMALAEVGRYAEAIELQQRVVDELTRAGRHDFLAAARERLEAYRRGEPVRSPWE
jgi:tetratricopeptide (TPR) repeat protein